jgi:hypothetical protein
MGFNLKEQKATIFNDGNDVWSTTPLPSIGLAVKNAVLLPEKMANRYFFINSFTVSQNQILAALEKATARQWEVKHVDAEEEKKVGMEKLSRGDISGGQWLIRYIICVDGHGGNYGQYKESANELLFLPKETLDEVIADIVKGQACEAKD